MDNLSSDQRALLRNYYRLVLSYKDFKHAYKCAEWLAFQGDDYIPENGLAESAYYSSAVVSYSRPFNSGGISKHGKVPRLKFENLPESSNRELEIHSYILLTRNELIAHTDANAVNLEPIIAADMPGSHVVPLVNDALAPFVTSYSTEFANLAERWMIWVVEERHRIEPAVLPYLNRASWNKIHGIND